MRAARPGVRRLRFGSSAALKYVRNAVETLCLPRGTVQRYRYLTKLVHPDLLALIPPRAPVHRTPLRGTPVLATYGYQVRLDHNSQPWNAVYPLRFGTIVDAHRTGERPTDVVHIYFRLGDYCRYGLDDGFALRVGEAAVRATDQDMAAPSHYYAAPGGAYSVTAERRASDESAFRLITDTLDPGHFAAENGASNGRV